MTPIADPQIFKFLVDLETQLGESENQNCAHEDQFG